MPNFIMVVNRDINNVYNVIPVHYCNRCMSLKIIRMDDKNSYCGSCYSAHVLETDYFRYEELLSEYNINLKKRING